MKTALSIAGSDSSGGAGIQADLKTMTVHGVYGMSVITALTAQNTMGVRGIFPVSEDFLRAQIDAVFEDIRPDAVKTGMIPSAELMKTAAERLAFYHPAHLVVDPVMVSTSRCTLMEPDALAALKGCLLPLAQLVTPNLPEAEVLADMKICGAADMKSAARRIAGDCGCAVLVKGGHSLSDANDYLYENGVGRWLLGRRIDNPNTHGTGCTLSSAIAANLACGFNLTAAVLRAKRYLSGALAAQLDLGQGSGPLDHAYLYETQSDGSEAEGAE